MCNPTKSIFAGSLGAAVAVGVLGIAAVCAAPVAAQSADKPPPTKAQPGPGPDPEFIVKPPPHGNPRLLKPAPPDRDPGLVKKPPADTRAPEDDPAAPSRQDDCRGTAGDCKQNTPR